MNQILSLLFASFDNSGPIFRIRFISVLYHNPLNHQINARKCWLNKFQTLIQKTFFYEFNVSVIIAVFRRVRKITKSDL